MAAGGNAVVRPANWNFTNGGSDQGEIVEGALARRAEREIYGGELFSMKAAQMSALRQPLEIVELPIPEPQDGEVLVRVQAEGICRTDWHVWNGDWDWVGLRPTLPVIPGHELGGVVEAVGADVREVGLGDRVTVPFHEACGRCRECLRGRTNLCDELQFLGISHDGGYAEYVAIHNADFNCIKLPDRVDVLSAAALGCRYMTAYHAVLDRGRVRAGEWVAVHGVGGVGLSAVQVATAAGAQVVAVDIDPAKLEKASDEGAVATVDARTGDVATQVKDVSTGGVNVSIAALGRAELVLASINCLRKRGRHVQVGLTSQEERGMVNLPIDMMIEAEIEFVGSVGNPHSRYPELLALVERGLLNPMSLVTREAALNEVNSVMEAMTAYQTVGFNVITSF